MQPTTAILLFSRSATAEAGRKFGRYGSTGTRIAGALIERTRRTLSRNGLPVYTSDGQRGAGTSFGERLARSMERVYAAGYQSVIVVGNDCPELSASHLRSAARWLATGQDVIGPDGRGGIYLLGLRRCAFDRREIAGLRWQTADLVTDLRERLRGAREGSLLRDVNTLRDLRLHWVRWKGRLSSLSYLVLRAVVPVAKGCSLTSRLPVGEFTGRAPPVAA